MKFRVTDVCTNKTSFVTAASQADARTVLANNRNISKLQANRQFHIEEEKDDQADACWFEGTNFKDW
jgi:hypothetical protein